jgi:nucleoside-diphosphate-sugar epimerase
MSSKNPGQPIKNTLSGIIKSSKNKNSAGKKFVLVTGGAGYLGSILVRKLLDQGYGVVVLDALYFGDESLKEVFKNPNLVFIKGNIEDIGDLSKSLERVEAVIHLAGIVGDPACSVDPAFTIQTNFFATQAFIKLCKYYKIKRFIFASTCSVYGAAKDKLNENSLTNPVSLYARSKLEAEEVLLSEADGSIDVVIMRMATLHGWSYRPRFDLVANLFAGKAASGEEITVQGGKQRRPLLHIEDAADAFIAALKAPKTKVAGQVFNVGFTRENYTILEIADLIKKNKPDAKIKIDEKVTDKRDYWVDFSKIESVLRIKPKRNIDESVKEIMREVRKKKIDIRNPKYSNYLQVLNTR